MISFCRTQLVLKGVLSMLISVIKCILFASDQNGWMGKNGWNGYSSHQTTECNILGKFLATPMQGTCKGFTAYTVCFFCLGSFQPLVADVCMQRKFKTYISFKRLGMVLAIYWSFIDLVQLCWITNLSKVGAKNGPHRHAGRVSLASTRCLQLSWLYPHCLQLSMVICIFIVWLSKTSNTFNERIVSGFWE